MKYKTIVLARVEEDSEVVGRSAIPISRGGGERIKWRTINRAKALIWLNKGTTSDVAKAWQFASQEGYTVFVYPTRERDPLGRAKKEIIKDL